MIIKQGEFMSFAPAELHSQKPERTASHRRPVQRERIQAEANQSKPADLLRELERLVRENERLTLERDQLREELSRQSLEARRMQRIRQIQEEAAEAPAPEAPSTAAVENLRRKPLTTTSLPDADEKAVSAEAADPGYELARVVVKWFWDDADEASVRLVHDALLGQGIRTIVRDADEDDA